MLSGTQLRSSHWLRPDGSEGAGGIHALPTYRTGTGSRNEPHLQPLWWLGPHEPHILPEAWQSSADYALKLGSFCGEIALAQYEADWDWLNEQPAASTLYNYEPGPNVRPHARTVVG